MSEDERLRGLRGWLVLVGLGLVISPLRIVATILQVYVPIFADGTWEALTTVGSKAYHHLWAPILIGELVFDVGMIVASVFLLYLFFSKNRLFPMVFVIVSLVSLLVIPLDVWLITLVRPNEPIQFSPTELARALVGGLIWIPYMFVSKRVKATFVESGV